MGDVIYQISKYRVHIAFAFILGISLALRIFHLGDTGYWIDEMSSIHFASNPGWNALLWDNSPPTYHAMLKGWIRLFGTSETATRSLSVIFSLLTTSLWFRWGLRKGGLASAVVAGFLHGICGFSIYFARETRMYSLFELTTTYFLLLTYWQTDEKINNLKTYLAATAVAVSHYLSVVPLMAWSAGNFLLGTNRKRSGVIVFVTSFLVILYIWVVRLESLQWQETKYQLEISSRHPGFLFFELFGNFTGTAAVLGLLTLLLWKSRTSAQKITLFFLVPVGLAWLASWYFERAVFLLRYFIFLAPLMILFVFLTFLEIQKASRASKTLFAALLSLFIVGQLQETWVKLDRVNPPWKEAAQLLNQKAPLTVFTSRPLSLKTPYFNEEKIKFIKIDKSSAEPFQIIFDTARSLESTWILENYWGFEMLRKNFYLYLNSRGCLFVDYTQRNESIEPIRLLKIECPVK